MSEIEGNTEELLFYDRIAFFCHNHALEMIQSGKVMIEYYNSQAPSEEREAAIRELKNGIAAARSLAKNWKHLQNQLQEDLYGKL